MKLPVTTWVVMIHNQDVGTFAPAFPNLDEAEEFSNAMRLLNDNMAVSEPVPVVPTNTLRFTAKGELIPEPD
jgi:hypothetical protein